jgi:hypothetical protein
MVPGGGIESTLQRDFNDFAGHGWSLKSLKCIYRHSYWTWIGPEKVGEHWYICSHFPLREKFGISISRLIRIELSGPHAKH